MMGHQDSRLNVDLGAITANWRYMDSLSTEATTTAAMVKADGYGLGAKNVAEALIISGCKEFFVANLGEAIALRQHLDEIGQTQPNIMTLHGCHVNQLSDHAAFRITPVLNDLDQLSRWRVFSQRKSDKLPAFLHIDTGMTRLGFDTEQIGWLIENKSALNGVNCRYVMSHLVSAEIANDQTNTRQLNAFNRVQQWFADIPASPVSYTHLRAHET